MKCNKHSGCAIIFRPWARVRVKLIRAKRGKMLAIQI